MGWKRTFFMLTILSVSITELFVFFLRGNGKEFIPAESLSTDLKNEVTIVSAFWNIGNFKKGDETNEVYTQAKYKAWCSVFKHIQNPVIFYTDSEEFFELMTDTRKHMENKTRIFKIDRKSLWAFEIVNQIKNIYDQVNYPKHNPNTVVPEYASAQHAKHAVLADAIRKKYFNTTYIGWLDIGYFRDLVNSNNDFELVSPSGMDPTSIAMNRIAEADMTKSIENIFKSNDVWVGGGFFLATHNVLLRFEELYRKAVMHFISLKLMNTDQQVIYALYSNEGKKLLNPDIQLQLYIPNDNGNIWFYLGYICRNVLSRNKVS